MGLVLLECEFLVLGDVLLMFFCVWCVGSVNWFVVVLMFFSNFGKNYVMLFDWICCLIFVGVICFVFNCFEKRNVLMCLMIDVVVKVFDFVMMSGVICVLIFEGEGNVFCVGMDLGEM